MTNFPFQSPKEKPFALNIRANGEPFDYEQWRRHVIEAIDGFKFSPDIGPLKVIGSQVDEHHLRNICHELQQLGWVAILEITRNVTIIISHPDGPEFPY